MTADQKKPGLQAQLAIRSQEKFKQGLYYFCGGQYEKALEFFNEANIGCHSLADLFLTIMYRDGLGTAQDFDLAEKCIGDLTQGPVWLELFWTKKDEAFTQYYLGYLYKFGIGVDHDSRQGFEHFTQAIALMKGEPFDSVIAELQRLVPGEIKREQLKLTAPTQYADALFHLADCYKRGNGVETDLPKALALYQCAAYDYGHPRAQYALGLYYQKNKNLKIALEFYLKAADQEYPGAQAKLNSSKMRMAKKEEIRDYYKSIVAEEVSIEERAKVKQTVPLSILHHLFRFFSPVARSHVERAARSEAVAPKQEEGVNLSEDGPGLVPGGL